MDNDIRIILENILPKNNIEAKSLSKNIAELSSLLTNAISNYLLIDENHNKYSKQELKEIMKYFKITTNTLAEKSYLSFDHIKNMRSLADDVHKPTEHVSEIVFDFAINEGKKQLFDNGGVSEREILLYKMCIKLSIDVNKLPCTKKEIYDIFEKFTNDQLNSVFYQIFYGDEHRRECIFQNINFQTQELILHQWDMYFKLSRHFVVENNEIREINIVNFKIFECFDNFDVFSLLNEKEWNVLNILSRQSIETINRISDSIKKCAINKIELIFNNAKKYNKLLGIDFNSDLPENQEYQISNIMKNLSNLSNDFSELLYQNREVINNLNETKWNVFCEILIINNSKKGMSKRISNLLKENGVKYEN